MQCISRRILNSSQWIVQGSVWGGTVWGHPDFIARFERDRLGTFIQLDRTEPAVAGRRILIICTEWASGPDAY